MSSKHFFSKYQQQNNLKKKSSSSTLVQSMENSNSDNNNGTLPEITITRSSSSTSQELNAILAQRTKPSFDINNSPTSMNFDSSLENNKNSSSTQNLPPAYGSESDQKSTDTATTSVSIPIPAHLPVSTPTAPCSDLLPSYAHATIDMPPSYSSTSKNINDEFGMSPIEPQIPWSITKKLYILGFFVWPLWFIGMGWCVFGREKETRKWAKRCMWNSLVVAAVFTYLLVGYFRTGSRLV
ncbi:3910_t:CDS:1 [Ambispora leptoticha]|uniref:3910_t:CDS:1 n=1 Tax=Ambispora leptoticha TaxID=144679 RepID=A0A9N9B318_9GLOM|nr:3910_t:CDS:1 [Ambispora leptoticha]